MLIQPREKYYFEYHRGLTPEYFLASLDKNGKTVLEPISKPTLKDQEPIFRFYGGDRIFLYISQKTISQYIDKDASVLELLQRGIRDIDKINASAVLCFYDKAFVLDHVVYKSEDTWREIDGTLIEDKDLFNGPLKIIIASDSDRRDLVFEKTPILSINDENPLSCPRLMMTVDSIETLSHFDQNDIPCIINESDGRNNHQALYKINIDDGTKITKVKDYSSDMTDALCNIRDIAFLNIQKVTGEYSALSYCVSDKTFFSLSAFRGKSKENVIEQAAFHVAIDCVEISSERHKNTDRVFGTAQEKEVLSILENLGIRDEGKARTVAELF